MFYNDLSSISTTRMFFILLLMPLFGIYEFARICYTFFYHRYRTFMLIHSNIMKIISLPYLIISRIRSFIWNTISNMITSVFNILSSIILMLFTAFTYLCSWSWCTRISMIQRLKHMIIYCCWLPCSMILTRVHAIQSYIYSRLYPYLSISFTQLLVLSISSAHADAVKMVILLQQRIQEYQGSCCKHTKKCQ